MHFLKQPPSTVPDMNPSAACRTDLPSHATDCAGSGLKPCATQKSSKRMMPRHSYSKSWSQARKSHEKSIRASFSEGSRAMVCLHINISMKIMKASCAQKGAIAASAQSRGYSPQKKIKKAKIHRLCLAREGQYREICEYRLWIVEPCGAIFRGHR